MVYRLIIPRFAPIGINSTVHVHDPVVAIIIYVAYRFLNPLWGAAGVIALVHDVLATAGLLALTHKEVNLVIVAAFLTSPAIRSTTPS